MRRLIDPREQAERALAEAEGMVTPRMMSDALAELTRYADAPGQRVIACETLVWHRADIGGAGDAAYLMRAPHPSSDVAWAMSVSPYVVPAQGRVLVARLWASEAVTAGTVTLRLRVIETGGGLDQTLEDVVLNTAATRQAAAVYPWQTAIQISAGATIEARAVTAGAMTPTTIDVTATAVIGYDLS